MRSSPVFLLLIVMSSFCTPAVADSAPNSPSSTVHWVTEEWEGYTEMSGNGFYRDLMRLLLTGTGIQIQIDYVPWKRALLLVRNGAAETTGVDVSQADLLMSACPVFYVWDAVAVKNNRLEHWQGPQSLAGLQGVSFLGAAANFSSWLPQVKIMEVSNRKSAVNVFRWRKDVDYYYDNEDQLRHSLSDYAADMPQSDYQIHRFRNGDNYWLFSKSPAGVEFKKIFDRQFAKYYCSGDLKKLYQRWQHQSEYPEGGVDCPKN